MPLHLKTECLNLKCSMVLIRAVTKILGLGTFLGYLWAWVPATFVGNKRKIEWDPWIVFRNDVVPPSWTLILPESWDKSKSVFKGAVDGFKIGEGEGTEGKNTPLSFLPPPFHRPSPWVFFVAFRDGGHDQCTSEFSLKNACSAG